MTILKKKRGSKEGVFYLRVLGELKKETKKAIKCRAYCHVD